MKTRIAAAAILLLGTFATQPGQANPPTMSDYYYFTCNATGWALNDQTRLQCLDPYCIDLALEYEVTEEWMVTGHDTCNLIRTDAYNGWGTRSESIGAYVEVPDREPVRNEMEAPSTARFYGSGPITVKYPRLGKYRIWLTRARAAFTITPVAEEPAPAANP